jgi:hypothetical protein
MLLEAYSNITKSFVFTEDKTGHLPDKKIWFYPLFMAQSLFKTNS